MEDTACGSKCAFVKMGFITTCEDCPNYTETWWQEGQTGNTRIVKDCAPKRIMNQLGALQARTENAQAAAEAAKRETLVMKQHFCGLVEASKQLIEERKQNLIEEKNK
jgi:hypothetical protein